MNLDQEVSLSAKLQAGDIRSDEAVFIAMCVRFAVNNGIAAKIGTFGVDVLTAAADRPAFKGV